MAEAIHETDTMRGLRDIEQKLRLYHNYRAVIEQIAAVAKDNHSEGRNSAAMALRFIENLATRAVAS